MPDLRERRGRNVQVTHAAIGKDDERYCVPGFSVARERSRAEDFDVIRMGGNGEDVQLERSGGFMDGSIGGLMELVDSRIGLPPYRTPYRSNTVRNVSPRMRSRRESFS